MVVFILFMILVELLSSSLYVNNNNDNNKTIELKLQIQFVAMLFLLVAVWLKYFGIVKSKKVIVETFDSIIK